MHRQIILLVAGIVLIGWGIMLSDGGASERMVSQWMKLVGGCCLMAGLVAWAVNMTMRTELQRELSQLRRELELSHSQKESSTNFKSTPS